MKNKRSFTLIELLIVIAIIGIITTIIFVSVRNGQSRGRDAKRVSDLEALNTAIQMYYRATGHFPSLPNECGERVPDHPEYGWINGKSSNQASAEASGKCFTDEDKNDNFIQGLSPSYIPKLPLDPGPSRKINGSESRGFVYGRYLTEIAGNQIECYKIAVFNPEYSTTQQYKRLEDPKNSNVWSLYSRGCAEK